MVVLVKWHVSGLVEGQNEGPKPIIYRVISEE
jgi:hypothetical protein